MSSKLYKIFLKIFLVKLLTSSAPYAIIVSVDIPQTVGAKVNPTEEKYLQNQNFILMLTTLCVSAAKSLFNLKRQKPRKA